MKFVLDTSIPITPEILETLADALRVIAYSQIDCSLVRLSDCASAVDLAAARLDFRCSQSCCRNNALCSNTVTS